MVTFAVSLLLVFRTNSSYSRWWEGRIIWGQVVNFARNYSRQVRRRVRARVCVHGCVWGPKEPGRGMVVCV